MPNIKISELPSVLTIDPTSMIPVVKGGDTVRVPHSGILNHSALTETNTVLDEDTLAVLQNGEMKKIKTSTLIDISGFPDAATINLTDFLVLNSPEGNAKINIEDFVSAISETIQSASVDSPGIISIASSSEVQSGTNSTDAVVPSTLKVVTDTKANLESPAFSGTPTVPTATAATNTTQIASTAFTISEINRLVPTATESASGKIELATGAETKAGLLTNRAIHPAGMLSCFASYTGTNEGWQEFPGGLIFQWGVTNPDASSSTVTYPREFGTKCYGVNVIRKLTSDTGGVGAAPALVGVPGKTTFSMSHPAGADEFYYWFAWGR